MLSIGGSAEPTRRVSAQIKKTAPNRTFSTKAYSRVSTIFVSSVRAHLETGVHVENSSKFAYGSDIRFLRQTNFIIVHMELCSISRPCDESQSQSHQQKIKYSCESI